MAEIIDIRARLRRALGDSAQRYRDTFPGGRTEYDIGRTKIDSIEVDLIAESVVTPVPDTEYTLDKTHGILTFDSEVAEGAQVMVTCYFFGLFEDFELDSFIEMATYRHLHEREVTTRYRNEQGFIRYEREDMTLETLPPIEEEALVIQATIEALYEMSIDAASDIDVWTAEGTHLARGQRFNQIMDMITVLQARYNDMCQQLNIGLNRIEMSTLRRVSKLTGRLVPVFREREYDESGPGSYPKRLLPPIDSPHEDESGLPSPIWGPY